MKKFLIKLRTTVKTDRFCEICAGNKNEAIQKVELGDGKHLYKQDKPVSRKSKIIDIIEVN